MNEKPTDTRSTDGGPSYAAFVYEMQAIHMKLDLLLAFALTNTPDPERRIRESIKTFDEGRLS